MISVVGYDTLFNTFFYNTNSFGHLIDISTRTLVLKASALFFLLLLLILAWRMMWKIISLKVIIMFFYTILMAKIKAK